MKGPAQLGPRLTLLALALVAMVLMSVSPAAAAAPAPPPDSETGKVGSHLFVDTLVAPGGSCTFGSTEEFGYYNGLARLGVRRMVAFARHGRMRQQIASMVRIQAWDGSRWLAYRPGHWQYKIATRSKGARFSARAIAVDFVLASRHLRRVPSEVTDALVWTQREKGRRTCHLLPGPLRRPRGPLARLPAGGLLRRDHRLSQARSCGHATPRGRTRAPDVPTA